MSAETEANCGHSRRKLSLVTESQATVLVNVTDTVESTGTSSARASGTMPETPNDDESATSEFDELPLFYWVVHELMP